MQGTWTAAWCSEDGGDSNGGPHEGDEGDEGLPRLFLENRSILSQRSEVSLT